MRLTSERGSKVTESKIDFAKSKCKVKYNGHMGSNTVSQKEQLTQKKANMLFHTKEKNSASGVVVCIESTANSRKPAF